MLGKGALGQSNVGIFYTFADSSLQDNVPMELPWYPFWKPRTHRFEILSTLLSLAYFATAFNNAASFA